MPTLYKRHFPIEYRHYLIGIVDFRRLAFSFLSTMLLERPKELTHLGTWESKPPMRESTKVVSEDYLKKGSCPLVRPKANREVTSINGVCKLSIVCG